MISDNMNQEVVNAEIKHYTSLLRIKKASNEVNKQLEIEIETSKATLKIFGVDISEFDFLLK
ncbi:MAG: hypothetical protein SPF18_06675 [Blautia sp.]|nr:hypothetical protein [Blautia sp.]